MTGIFSLGLSGQYPVCRPAAASSTFPYQRIDAEALEGVFERALERALLGEFRGLRATNERLLDEVAVGLVVGISTRRIVPRHSTNKKTPGKPRGSSILGLELNDSRPNHP
jgi:hypothetical protein